ncbi:DUF4097 family beta strand repeat-containing protein [Aestuariivivens insulae]|uniref:hypothetical protein n=1 Tax=Aestuariivivens insulae TaxID=1621988 RepID=UPI001F57809F|nr:hypothetical protein [Aestuariivivens insulae]
MKRALHFKTLVTCLMLPLFISATSVIKDKHSKTKTINKEFSVNADASLKVKNSYGNLDIVTWNENRIVFEITITASGKDEEKVMEKLNAVDVTFSATKDLVAAETKFNKKSSKSWWDWGGKSKVNIKVNYVIKMPISNHVNLKNNYGNINLEKLEGKATIHCDYGKITTGELMADDNALEFDYSKGCYFEYIKSGSINADYSEFTVSKAQKIDLNADYTNSKIEIAEDVNYNCDYGNIKIDKANNIVGNGDYLTTIIGDVYKSVTLKADYGNIKIGRMDEHATNATIDSDYTGIKIGYDPNYNFKFNLDLDYASFTDKDGLTVTKETKNSVSKLYQGYHGNQSSNNVITIKSDYGNVTFFKN